MPSLNGKWIFHNHFTNSQWESMRDWVGVQMQFKACLGYYNGNYEWSNQYEYFSAGNNISYDNDMVCFEDITPSISGYKGDWYASGSTAFGYNGRFIEIIDDGGMGDDDNFYNIWTSIATKIDAFPIINTKWLFNTEISNPIDYAANDEDIEIEGLFKSNNTQYSLIRFDLYRANIWELYYGGISVYGFSDGWDNNNYKTLNIYEFPDIPYYDLGEDPAEANGIIDAIALICRNSTYQGSADPLVKTYKLG